MEKEHYGMKQLEYCVKDSDSSGFENLYPTSWENGCMDRVCCEQHCCDDGLLYDKASALCLPEATCKDKSLG